MVKRRVIWLGLLVLASLAAGLAIVCAFAPTDESAFRLKKDEIEFRMTKSQVEAIFGGPGTPHDTEDVPDFHKGNYREAWEWNCGESQIVVYLDGGGRTRAFQSNFQREPHLIEQALKFVRQVVP